jgi:hypothetical protein
MFLNTVVVMSSYIELNYFSRLWHHVSKCKLFNKKLCSSLSGAVVKLVLFLTLDLCNYWDVYVCVYTHMILEIIEDNFKRSAIVICCDENDQLINTRDFMRYGFHSCFSKTLINTHNTIHTKDFILFTSLQCRNDTFFTDRLIVL